MTQYHLACWEQLVCNGERILHVILAQRRQQPAEEPTLRQHTSTSDMTSYCIIVLQLPLWRILERGELGASLEGHAVVVQHLCGHVVAEVRVLRVQVSALKRFVPHVPPRRPR